MAEELVRLGGLSLLETLQYNSEEEIRQRAAHLLERHLLPLSPDVLVNVWNILFYMLHLLERTFIFNHLQDDTSSWVWLNEKPAEAQLSSSWLQEDSKKYSSIFFTVFICYVKKIKLHSSASLDRVELTLNDKMCQQLIHFPNKAIQGLWLLL